mmetsp:Transcript_26392/g.53616  ORF Transcript_26392/g.53616 Transcript_26392/m.53616 type:complete len:252 (-) Transcript_26392:369-1124(-)
MMVNNISKSSITLLVLLAATASPPAVADNQHEPTLAKLARCPAGYKHNGEKCTRERQVIDRDVVPAECPPGMTYRKRYTFKCYSETNSYVPPAKPTCPDGYDVHGQQCHAPCPRGYQSKIGQCILPADTLSDKYMTCPEGLRRIGAFCEDKHIECDVGDSVPGTFYYRDGGRCERDKSVLNREYALVKKGGSCPEGQVLVGKSYCQDPCPEFYRARRGACELRKCIIRTDGMMDHLIMCPEGTFPNPMAKA